jgi:hypothetical protein
MTPPRGAGKKNNHQTHRRRGYHSRWALSVYGKEPGVPDEEYVGYEESLEEFEKHGKGGT